MISIVIPIFNEEQFLNRFVSDLVTDLNKTRLKYEIILSENGSQDNTLDLANKLAMQIKNLKVITSKSPNYGLAVKEGFLYAKGEYLALFDLDYYDVPFLSKSLVELKTVDAVIGVKRGPGAKDNRKIVRKLTTLIFSSLLKLAFGMKISDTHGIKILKKKSFLPIIKKSHFTKDIFDTELLIRAQYEGLAISEIPVEVIEKRSSRTSILKRILRTVGHLISLKIYLVREYNEP